MLRQTILWLARSERIKKLISTMPVSSGIVSSYVPGEDTASAVRATEELIASGLHVTLDHLGEDTLDPEQAEATVNAYLDVLAALGAAGLARNAEVSVKLCPRSAPSCRWRTPARSARPRATSAPR